MLNSITAFIATTGAFLVYADNIELQSFIKLCSLHFGENFLDFNHNKVEFICNKTMISVRFLLSLPWSVLLLLPPLAPQPMALPQLRSSPLSHSLTSTESLMTTQKPISRRPKLRMPTATLLDLSPLLSQTAESRPPPTQLITRMDSSPR